MVVGQLCVAKNYRGLGLVQQMYQHFKKSLSGEYDYCITDVAENNPRSLKVHLKTGFQVINTIRVWQVQIGISFYGIGNQNWK